MSKGNPSNALSQSEALVKGCHKIGPHGQKIITKQKSSGEKSWTIFNHQLRIFSPDLWNSVISTKQEGNTQPEAMEALAAVSQACMDQVVTLQEVMG